jgi:hypothetical protein
VQSAAKVGKNKPRVKTAGAMRLRGHFGLTLSPALHPQSAKKTSDQAGHRAESTANSVDTFDHDAEQAV